MIGIENPTPDPNTSLLAFASYPFCPLDSLGVVRSRCLLYNDGGIDAKDGKVLLLAEDVEGEAMAKSEAEAGEGVGGDLGLDEDDDGDDTGSDDEGRWPVNVPDWMIEGGGVRRMRNALPRPPDSRPEGVTSPPSLRRR